MARGGQRADVANELPADPWTAEPAVQTVIEAVQIIDALEHAQREGRLSAACAALSAGDLSAVVMWTLIRERAIRAGAARKRRRLRPWTWHRRWPPWR